MSEIWTYNLGRFKITALDYGRFKLDGGAMFGVVPRLLWQHYHPADENNRIEMALRGLLIEVDSRKIIVDTGFGEGRAPKFKDMYDFNGEDDYLHSALHHIGLTVQDITDVLITHLHFDHNGGSTVNKNTAPQPTFPNARYYIQKRQLEHARRRLERDKASYLPEDFEPLLKAGVAEVVDGIYELTSGLEVVVCEGHTPAMQLPRIRQGNQIVLYGADLIPLHSHFPLPWIMAYDLYPVTTLEEKRRILSQAAAEKWLIIFEHDPFHIAGWVVDTPRGYSFVAM